MFSHAIYSDDEGLTWQLSASIAGGNECQAALLPNGTNGHAPGTILMNMRNPRGQRLAAYSVTDGAEWSDPQLITVGGRTKYAGGTCEGSTIALGGSTLLFSTPFHLTERANMT